MVVDHQANSGLRMDGAAILGSHRHGSDRLHCLMKGLLGSFSKAAASRVLQERARPGLIRIFADAGFFRPMTLLWFGLTAFFTKM